MRRFFSVDFLCLKRSSDKGATSSNSDAGKRCIFDGQRGEETDKGQSDHRPQSHLVKRPILGLLFRCCICVQFLSCSFLCGVSSDDCYLELQICQFTHETKVSADLQNDSRCRKCTTSWCTTLQKVSCTTSWYRKFLNTRSGFYK